MRIIKRLSFLILIILLTCCSSAKRFTAETDSENYEQNNYDEKGLIFIEQGIASYYADEYHGKKTASGEIYNMNDLTAAHPHLPFGVKLLVRNLKNNKSVVVRVNDRMPQFKGRVIDLSLAAAKKIEMIADGTVEVRIYKVGK